MCLKYGTPHRFYRAMALGEDLPQECHDKTTLLAYLQAEFESGAYDDPALFHPMFMRLLRVLAYEHHRLPEEVQEPRYPFCDIIQGSALIFGLSNTDEGFRPAAYQMCAVALPAYRFVQSTSMLMVRDLIYLLPDDEKPAFQGLYVALRNHAGFIGWIQEANHSFMDDAKKEAA